MKKFLTLFAVVILFVGISYSQSNDTERATLLKQIAKNDANIQNPKKNIKYQTWAKRGDLYLKAYSLNFTYLYQGLEYGTIPLLGISDNHPLPYYGKPLQETVEGNFTVWTYSRLKIYISADGLVDHWEDLDPIDTLALIKSYDAYNKAIELDGSKKYINKKSTQEQIQLLRDNLMNKSFEYYNNNNAVKALEYLEKSIRLLDYPRTDADTFAQIGAYYYYAGIFAYNAHDLNKSKDYFNKAINSDYDDKGTCFQYVSQVMYEQGDTLDAVQFLEDGAKKYPSEVKIIYSLIDYYTPKGEYDKAFQYFDQAIAMTPNNPILYVVKAGAIEKLYVQLEANYFKLLHKADSLDKAEYRFRNDQDKVAELKAEKENILNNLVPTAEQNMMEYAQKTIDAYKKGISLDTSGKPDFNYSLALFYYTRSNTYYTNSSSIRKLTDIVNKLNTQKEEFLKYAKAYAETALAMDENDIYTLNLLSKIYYKLGNTDKSEEMKLRISNLQN